ncbi:MAG: FtsW/RodA/SpoVE family cell cycle protein [Bacilli bacterium]|nr:FtsW/RodA/SpoVE family cell cycle protein [Bacilli bacterium]
MKKLINRMDKPLLIVTIIMFLFGLLMVFSASNVRAALFGNPYSIFFKHAIILFICSIASIFIIVTPIKKYRFLAPFALYCIIGALIFVFSYGAVINSARRWLDFGFFHFQPSEFAKTIIIFYMAIYYGKHYKSDSYVVLYKPILYAFAIVILTFLQPDFGTSCIIMGIVTFTFLAVPITPQIKRKAFQIGIGAIILFAFILVLNDKPLFRQSQLDRLTFLNPCQRYRENTGYQVCNGFIAINNGGLFGVGLGNSTQKYLYLPAAHTDFIFPVIVEELGLLIGIIIILIFVFIFYRLLKIANHCYSLSGSIIVYGVAMYFIFHVLVNLVGVLGLFPLTGAPLPFLSYGGSYVLNLSIALALVQRVEIENKLKIKEKILKQGKR